MVPPHLKLADADRGFMPQHGVDSTCQRCHALPAKYTCVMTRGSQTSYFTVLSAVGCMEAGQEWQLWRHSFAITDIHMCLAQSTVRMFSQGLVLPRIHQYPSTICSAAPHLCGRCVLPPERMSRQYQCRCKVLVARTCMLLDHSGRVRHCLQQAGDGDYFTCAQRTLRPHRRLQ